MAHRSHRFCPSRDGRANEILLFQRNMKSVKIREDLCDNKKRTMKKRVIEIAVKVLAAALTAFLTAITTTSCMGYGPF